MPCRAITINFNRITSYDVQEIDDVLRTKFTTDVFRIHQKTDQSDTNSNMTHKGTFPGARALLSRGLVHLIDLDELCLWLKEFVPVACSWRDIEVLVNFPYRTLLFQHNLIFKFLTWNFAHIKTLARLACRKKFRTFWRSLFEIWRWEDIGLFHR